MATIKIDKFGGIAPRQHPTQLADGMAVMAHNVRLKNGKISPLRQPKIAEGIRIHKENGLTDISNANSIHVWEKRDGTFEFIVFPGITWKTEGNVADDLSTRIIVSGDTGRNFTDTDGKVWANAPMMMYRDGKGNPIYVTLSKNPISPLKVSRADGSVELDDNRRYTFLFVTWVDGMGFESPVSEPSLVYSVDKDDYIAGDLEYMDGDTISISPIEDLPEEAKSVRIYKVVTGSEEGRIQFVKELDRNFVINTPFFIKVKDEDAGEVLNPIETMPPDLQCVNAVPGNFYCGFSLSKPKTVMFSEVGLLYSWPLAYQYDVKDNVVALAVAGNSVFVMTDGAPYVLSGTTPESITVTKVGEAAACLSSRGVCVYNNVVYFVSNAGLMAIAVGGELICKNITETIFTREQWQAFRPETCRMSVYDGVLRLFFDPIDGLKTGLNIDLNESSETAITTHDESAKCTCVDAATDKMYFVREDL